MLVQTQGPTMRLAASDALMQSTAHPKPRQDRCCVASRRAGPSLNTRQCRICRQSRGQQQPCHRSPTPNSRRDRQHTHNSSSTAAVIAAGHTSPSFGAVAAAALALHTRPTQTALSATQQRKNQRPEGFCSARCALPGASIAATISCHQGMHLFSH